MRLLTIIFFATFLLTSCEQSIKKMETLGSIETKDEFISRIFYEQSKQQAYYTDKWLNALSKMDMEKMDVYRDSVNMAYYCSSRMFNEMHLKKTKP